MVYRGRPSTGCKRCRERKIKCDERAEGCEKCAERGFFCPGYDRTVDAFFHDETANVQAKAKKSKAKAIAARDARDARDVRDRVALLQVKPRDSPGMQITATLIDQGLSFFMTHYSTGVDQPSIQSAAYHKHLSTDGFHPLVATSMTALGIAGVANLYMDPALKHEATRLYLNAIKMANKAISSPKEVIQDTTLIAVNLLGMFEATFNENSLAGWSNHVDGAASLVKMRGMDQFSTLAGQRMYLHTIGNLTMNCMGKGVGLPEYVKELNSEVINHLDIDDPRHAFFFLHIRTIDLRARILGDESPDLADIIRCALELDENAKSIFHDKTSDWNYDVVECGIQPGVFGSFYHVYSTAASAQTWNWVRYNRIYFHDIIRYTILAGFSASPPTLAGSHYHEQLESSTRTLFKLQADIIASMPQFLHDVPMTIPSKSIWNSALSTPSPSSAGIFSAATKTPPDHCWLTPPETPHSAYQSPSPTSHPESNVPKLRIGNHSQPPFCKTSHKAFHKNFRGGSVPIVQSLIGNGSITDRLPIVRIAGGYSTVWSLYVAGAMPIASSITQDYVYSCLLRIEEEFGIKQAKVLANALWAKRRLDKAGAVAFGICPQYLPPGGGPDVAWQGAGSKVSDGHIVETRCDDSYGSLENWQAGTTEEHILEELSNIPSDAVHNATISSSRNF